jgi:hypothetical protein
MAGEIAQEDRIWTNSSPAFNTRPAICVNSSVSLDAEEKSALAPAGLGEAGLPVAA